MRRSARSAIPRRTRRSSSTRGAWGPRHDYHDDERPPRLRDRGGLRRGVRAHGPLAQRRLADRRVAEVARRRRAQGDDQDARAGAARRPGAARPGGAELKGANAVIAFRFDTSELGTTWTEICA